MNPSTRLLRLLAFLILFFTGSSIASAQIRFPAASKERPPLGSVVGPVAPCDCTLPPGQCPDPSCPAGSIPHPDVQADSDCYGCPLGTNPPTCPAGSDPAACPGNMPGDPGACAQGNWNVGQPPMNPVPQLMLRKFVPTNGCDSLLSLELTLTGVACVQMCVENEAAVTCQAGTAQTSTILNMSSPSIPALGMITLPVIFNTMFPPLPPFDGTNNCVPPTMHPPGSSGITLRPAPEVRTMCLRIVDPAILAAFTDTTPGNPNDDFVLFNHQAASSSNFFGCSPVTFSTRNFASLEAAVSYSSCECTVNAVDDLNNPVCFGDTIDIDVTANDTSSCGSVDCSTIQFVGTVPNGFSLFNCGMASCTGCRVRYNSAVGPTSGTVSVMYRIGNGQSATCNDTATVSVNISRVDAVNDPAFTCPDQNVFINILANDTSTSALQCPPPASDITLGAVSPPTAGTATVVTGQGSCANALCPQTCVLFDPSPSFIGVATFTYTIRNAQGCMDTATVTVTVRTPPIAVNETVSTCRGTPVTINILSNDSSDTPLQCPPPNSDIMLGAVSPAGAGTATVVTGQAACGNALCNQTCVQFTPSGSFTGAATFTYTILDNDNCPATATVTVNVLTPPVAVNDTETTCQGDPVLINILGNDSSDTPLQCPPPASDITLGAVSPAGAGTATVVTGQGTCVNSLCPQTCVQFTPSGVFTGTATFTYTIRDNDNCTATASVSVTVLTPPDAVNDTVSACRNVPRLINILSNDTSPAGPIQCNMITLSSVSPAGAGSVALTTDPSCTNALCNLTCVQFTPGLNFSGTASFTYTIKTANNCDDTATVTINVCQVTAQDTVADVCAGDMVEICLPISAANCGGQVNCSTLQLGTPTFGTVVPVSCSITCSGCCVKYTAPSNPPGDTATFTYQVTGPAPANCTDTGMVTVTINPSPTVPDQSIPKDPADPTPIPIDLTPPGSDPGTGCQFDLASIMILDPPDHGTLNPGGMNPGTDTVTYTMDATFVDMDSFRYKICNTCGCCTEATVVLRVDCPTTNRLDCASLLLFPEFDNTTGSKTLITITDGCCGTPFTNTRVEVVLRRKDTCLETNRTYTLTPCDTISFLTSTIGPSGTKGYLYAFAKNTTSSPGNPLGTPIVFNHLIGQEMMIDGITTFDYAVNAVAFRGLGAEGEPNDDDADGIRDLNGTMALFPEYEGAPDQILIPRFLGQGGVHTSDIVLIALSGGSQFDTTIDFLVFNDNESASSGQHTFRCWKKLPLLQFAGGTSNGSLMTGDDPSEILGANREAGWLLLDGNIAQSTQETIDDPAFYAVLVERANGRAGADLPWELCLQDNGDLLPQGLFGDGGNTAPGAAPVNGDDQ